MAEGLRLVEESLNAAAKEGDIEGLYRSIKEDPTVLDRIDAIPFVETPLHVAASAGQLFFMEEILRLKPSFGRKLNPDGLSSLHLALINRHFSIARILVYWDKELMRVKGKEGETPLHFIVKKEDIDGVDADQQQREDPRIPVLAEFLFACPSQIFEDLTIYNETVLHIAVKAKNKCAVEIILGVIHRTSTSIGCASDYQGNTVLHVAVANSQLEMVELLVKEFSMRDVNQKNSSGKTALDIALSLESTDEEARSIEKCLRDAGASTISSSAISSSSTANQSFAEFLRTPERRVELFYKFLFFSRRSFVSMEERNLGLVVAVLVATATYQGILSPPGWVGGGNDQLLRNGSYVTANVSSTNDLIAANTSFINATFFSSTPINANTSFINATFFSPTPADVNGLGSTGVRDFYTENTVAFFFSMMMIIFFLPLGWFGPLHVALFFLFCSYFISITRILYFSSIYSNSVIGLFHSAVFGSMLLVYGCRLYLDQHLDDKKSFQMQLILLRNMWGNN